VKNKDRCNDSVCTFHEIIDQFKISDVLSDQERGYIMKKGRKDVLEKIMKSMGSDSIFIMPPI
jgi:hypothetical protein